MSVTSRSLALLALLALAACPARRPPAPRPEDPRDEPPEACAPRGPAPKRPDPVCRTGARWAKGTPAFRDATAEWGLDALGVEGVRLNVVDLDGDGWPDLVVRRGGVRSDDFKAGGTRHTWVLRNTGHGFEDVTEASGLLLGRGLSPTAGRPGEVMAFADLDNDGHVDAYTGLTTADPALSLGETSEVLLGDGGGRFRLGPADNPLRRVDEVDVPAGASFLDFDLDGTLDLWVPQHSHSPPARPNSLLFQTPRLWWGDGTGRFLAANDDLRLHTAAWSDLQALDEGRAHPRAWSAAACDLNGDGLPELLAASYGRAPNHLWQAEGEPGGTVVYTNRSVASGYAYDADQSWKDNQFARCWCQQNRAEPHCQGVPLPQISCPGGGWNDASDRRPHRLGGNSGATVCTDLDNDGHIDLVTTEIQHWWAGAGSDHAEILKNTGEPDVRFVRPGRQATGLVVPHPTSDWNEGFMTASAFDFDNDGWQDLYLGGSDYPGNRGLLFRQVSPLVFEPVAMADGIDHHRSHGVAVADFDRDGDLDVVVGHSLARCDASQGENCYGAAQVRFFENVTPPGHWLQLDLRGCTERTNALSVGARVSVTAGGITQTQEVGGGYGHYGAQNDRVLHFGLGDACEAEVTVRWPNRDLTTRTFRLPAGHRFVLREDGHPEAAGR